MNQFASLRIKAKLRQDEVAEKLHVDRSTISKWETGTALPHADKLIQLSFLYNCSIEDLLRGTEKQEEKKE